MIAHQSQHDQTDPESELLALGIQLKRLTEYRDADWMKPWERRRYTIARHKKLGKVAFAGAALVLATYQALPEMHMSPDVIVQSVIGFANNVATGAEYSSSISPTDLEPHFGGIPEGITIYSSTPEPQRPSD